MYGQCAPGGGGGAKPIIDESLKRRTPKTKILRKIPARVPTEGPNCRPSLREKKSTT